MQCDTQLTYPVFTIARFLEKCDGAANSMSEDVSRVQLLSANALKIEGLPSETFFTNYVSLYHIYRPFCGRCGTKLFWHQDDLESVGVPNAVTIMLGTLNHKHLEEGNLISR